jgi:hypothetical protein
VATLKETLLTPENRPKVVDDAVRLVDSEVASKGGLSGIAIKTGYKAVNSVKPTLVREAVDTLLDRFVERLEPFAKEWEDKGKSGGFDAFLSSRSKQVANALLGVTDDRARSIASGTVKKTYDALRPQGEKNVEAAVPGLGRLLARYHK